MAATCSWDKLPRLARMDDHMNVITLSRKIWDIRKRGVGFRATQSSLGVFRDSKDIKDPKTPRYLQVKVNLELNLQSNFKAAQSTPKDT